MVKMENSPFFLFHLSLNSSSCTPQQGSLLHLTSYKMHFLPFFCCMLALNRKLLCADIGVKLGHNGEKVHSSSGYILRASQLLHALISFLLFVVLVRLLTLYLFHVVPPSQSFFKSLGSLWCHSMRHHSSGAILYPCTVV